MSLLLQNLIRFPAAALVGLLKTVACRWPNACGRWANGTPPSSAIRQKPVPTKALWAHIVRDHCKGLSRFKHIYHSNGLKELEHQFVFPLFFDMHYTVFEFNYTIWDIVIPGIFTWMAILAEKWSKANILLTYLLTVFELTKLRFQTHSLCNCICLYTNKH